MPVIVAVDDSGTQTRLLTEAAKLARAFDETLSVVHVLPQSKFREMEQKNVDKTGKTIDLDTVRSVAKEVADDAADGVVDAYTPVGLVGSPEDEIVKYADKNEAPYIVVGSRKRSPTGKALFGSTTQSVLLNSEIPVLTVMNRSVSK